jgi:hypothetical protein
MYLCTVSLVNIVSAWLPGVVNGFLTISVRPKAAVGSVVAHPTQNCTTTTLEMPMHTMKTMFEFLTQEFARSVSFFSSMLSDAHVTTIVYHTTCLWPQLWGAPTGS